TPFRIFAAGHVAFAEQGLSADTRQALAICTHAAVELLRTDFITIAQPVVVSAAGDFNRIRNVARICASSKCKTGNCQCRKSKSDMAHLLCFRGILHMLSILYMHFSGTVSAA